VLSVVLALAGCATVAGGESRAVAPQSLSSAKSAYPATPFARIETDMHVAAFKRIDLDAAERFLVSGSDDKTVRVWDLATGTLLQTLRLPIDDGNVGKVYAGSRSRRTDGRSPPAGSPCMTANPSLFTCSTARAGRCAGVSAASKKSSITWPFPATAGAWRRLYGVRRG
jgi:WD40 repeat protein